MTKRTTGTERLPHRIARLYLYGTWLASILIAAGIFLTLMEPIHPLSVTALKGDSLTKLGIGVFILMPITRVLLMLWTFLRERDRIYTVISAMVLMTILISAFIH